MKPRNLEQGTRNKDSGPASPATEGRGFRGLLAWQKADELASAVYRALGKMAAEHRWLRSQVLRATISVPANIAEGHGRGSLGDYLRFLDIARGSLAELEYYLHFIQQECMITGDEAIRLQGMQQEAGKLLHGLWRSLKQKARDGGWDHTGLINNRPTSPAANSSADLEGTSE